MTDYIRLDGIRVYAHHGVLLLFLFLMMILLLLFDRKIKLVLHLLML